MRRLFCRNGRGGYRPDDRHSPRWLANSLRRAGHRFHPGSGKRRGACPAALPLDFWHAAGRVEAPDTLGRWRYGTLGFIALPNVFLFQLLLPQVSPVIDLLFLGSLLLWGLAQLHVTRLPQLWTAEDVERALIFFAAFMLIDLLTCVVAFALERHEEWTLLLPLLLQRFYYRQLMYVVLFRAIMHAVQGRAVGWRGVEPELPTPVAQA